MNRIALFFLLLLLTLNTPILADWNDGDSAKWVQRPDPTELGIDVSCSYEYLLADDFLCSETGPITGIHIWGSWLDDFIPFNEDPGAVTFILSLHRDIPAEQSPTGYSMPGEVLWWRTFEPGEFQVRLWSEGVWEGWMYPPEQYISQADQMIWQYNFEIPETEAFVQEGSQDDPIVYWLDLKAYPADQFTQFGWKTSRDHWNDDAVWTFGDEPYSGLWEELRYPPGHELEGQSIDLAFVIAMPDGPEERDYGDCPDTYRTLDMTSGPSHPLNHPYTLGPRIDGEPDGQPHPQALGDDLNGIDDEDGVDLTLTPFVQGQNATIEVTAGGLSAWLQGWIDFDGDGTFVGPNDQIFVDQWLNIGPNTLNFTVPNSAVAGPTFARFRLCVDMGIGYAGAESYGEVEDYQVFIIAPPPEEDWGDCPRPYRTQGIDGGPHHTATQFLTLGPDIDTEPDGQPHPQALGDDLNGIDDEDGVIFLTPLELGATADIELTAGFLGGWLQAWIDFNGDKDFIDPGEQILTDYWLGGTVVVNIPIPAGATPGPTFSRFRLSNQTGLGPNGPATWGEVEDHMVILNPPPSLQDWGDAPDGYQTRGAVNGPEHTATVFLTLGPQIDTEPDGQPHPHALGDDLNNIDDEDGVRFPTTLFRGQTAQIEVTAGFLGGWLQGWIDYDHDGTFNGPDDHEIVNYWLNGTDLIEITVPQTAIPGPTFARFRLSTQLNLPFEGPALWGEVEDYEVFIEDFPPSFKWIQPPDLDSTGVDVNATMEYLLADDFECVQSGPIHNILVWGSWLGDYIPFGEDPGAVDFTLSFHNDIPANQSETGYSMPGDLLWLYTAPAGSYDIYVWRSGIEEGWLNPPIDYIFPADETCWLYWFRIPGDQAFWQEGSPTNPIVYWLDLQAEPHDPQARFGWKTTQENWNDDAVWVQAVEPYQGDWFELRYPPGHAQADSSIDLAFAFPGEPIFWDFGDAPDNPAFGFHYRTLAAHAGARHMIDPAITLGPAIDDERDGQPDPAALGDDNNGIDDEDGVTFLNPPLTPGTFEGVDVEASVDGNLSLWIDFEGDGDFADAFDQVFLNEPLTAGMNTLWFIVPVTGQQEHPAYARFRFSTGPITRYWGVILDGEVEDYRVGIEASDPNATPDDLPPQQFRLYRSVPNPFDESSLIRYDLPDAQLVDLSIYTIDGRKVITLVHDSIEAGRHAAVWNGRDEKGQQVAPGIYFYRIDAGPYQQNERMMMVR